MRWDCRFLAFLRRISPALALCASTAGCGGEAPRPLRPAAPPPAASSAPQSAASRGSDAVSRASLGAAKPIGLPASLLPVLGEDAVLLLAQAANEREAFLHFVDSAGQRGPQIALVDEFVLSAFRTTAGDRGVVTQRGEETCIVRFVGSTDSLASRGCERLDAKVFSFVQDRFAFFSLRRAPEKDKPIAEPAPKAPLPPEKPKPAPIKKNTGKAGKTNKAGKGTKSKKPAVVKKPTPRQPSEVAVRFASMDGVFEEEQMTGLSFVMPLDGMGLIDATPSSRGIELAWFEASKPSAKARRPKPKKEPPALGWASIQSAAIGLDGALVEKSRAMLLEGELDWGSIRGFFWPKWIVSSSLREASLLTQQSARGGPCDVSRVSGSGGPQRAVCAIDPGASPTYAQLSSLERIFEAEPRRAFGQPKYEPSLVVWAKDRGYFLNADATTLRTAGRDAQVHDEGLAFPAQRDKVAWSRVWPDGTGIALVNDQVVSIDSAGVVKPGLSRQDVFPMGRGALGRAAGIAKIGGAVWLARVDLGRVAPSPLVPQDFRSRAHPDATALVGGPERALFLALSGGKLHIAGLDAEGASTLPSLSNGRARAHDAPIRPGFLAVERLSGGAIVAGVSADNPTKVIAFVVDPNGKVGPLRKTSLAMREGEASLRLLPLPQGGALLSNSARAKAIWLSDDAEEMGAADWPRGEAEAVCLDGTPGPQYFPSPFPEAFVEPKALGARGSCVLGEPAWAPDGSLRWFGTAKDGLDRKAQFVIERGLSAPLASPSFPQATPSNEVRAAAPRPCPPEMVLVNGKLCVDRFEATIVDMASGEPLSPDYPVTPNLMEFALADFATVHEHVGDLKARAMPLPWFPPFQRGQKLDLIAVPRRLSRPNGYVTGLVAETACQNAGKRLCTLPEFVLACRGDRDMPFPYGDAYESGVCNVNRDTHPAAELHDNASIGHLDPRLNRVKGPDGPLFRETGASLRCRSNWGNDAIYDMVGNLDEWVDEGSGAFAGGFYARSTKAGCDAVITAHPKAYLDYSTGIRCCKDAQP